MSAESRQTVNLFQALLSLELDVGLLPQQDFLAAFADRLETSGDWVTALQRLTMDGLRDGHQSRLPLTWSDRDAKATNITGWTVTAAEPKGNARMASAILDFWTYDMVAVAARLQRNEPGLQPNLFERPVLKFGATLVQLPWIVGLQNNSSAAINNLRRLALVVNMRGTRRDGLRQVLPGCSRRVEFTTLLNWQPPRGEDDPGEVDLIATLGHHLFVIEVKSTFMRGLSREAWLHATTTLRKVGPISFAARSKRGLSSAIASDHEFRALLGLTEDRVPTQCHGWIADTSIECDHQRFGGFLKVSVEELLIALRDDRHLLNDPEGLLAGNDRVDRSRDADTQQSHLDSLSGRVQCRALHCGDRDGGCVAPLTSDPWARVRSIEVTDEAESYEAA